MRAYSNKLIFTQLVIAAAGLCTAQTATVQQDAVADIVQAAPPQDGFILKQDDNQSTTREFYAAGHLLFSVKTDKDDGSRYEKYYNKDGELEKYVTHRVGEPLIEEFYIGSYIKQKLSFSSGQTTETWTLNGKLHREDGPAKTLRQSDGSITEEYYFEGELYRDKGPAFIEQDADGRYFEKYYRHGKLHNDNGWAVFSRDEKGTTRQEYYQNDKLHRDIGPAITQWGADGSLHEEYWLIGKRGRADGGPMVVITTKDYTREEYYAEVPREEGFNNTGVLHREDGPAILDRYANGSTLEQFYSHGTLTRTVARDPQGNITRDTKPEPPKEEPERKEGNPPPPPLAYNF